MEIFFFLFIVSRLPTVILTPAFCYMQTNTLYRFFLGCLIVQIPHAIALNFLGLFLDAACLQTSNIQSDVLPSLVLTAVSSALLALFNHVDEVRCRNAALADNATQGEKRAQSLLSHLCEAVATLNQTLRFAVPSPKLAALLLQPDTNDAFYGKSFTELLINEDRAMFEEFVFDTSRLDGSGRLKVRLRSSDAQHVKCELHHVRLAQMDFAGNEEVWHLIGICELGDHSFVHTGTAVHSSIPETHACIVTPEHSSLEGSVGIGLGVEMLQQDYNHNDSINEIGHNEQTGMPYPTSSIDHGAQRQDDNEHIELAVAWHKCEVNLYDACKELVLQSDVAAAEEVTAAMTKWSSARDFFEDLANDTLSTLKDLHRHNELRQTSTNLSMKCNVSLAVHLQITPEMLTRKMPKMARTGKRTDPLQHYRFAKVICKKSKRCRNVEHGGALRMSTGGSSSSGSSYSAPQKGYSL